MVKKKHIRKSIKDVSIVISQILNNLKKSVNIQNNNPPTTGDGIQNFSNRLTLFFIKLPIINKIIAKIKVKVISNFKEYKKITYLIYCNLYIDKYIRTLIK